MDLNEKRVRAITKFYYSNPKVQEALLEFARDREVVPCYFEGFGKRPDSLVYPSDILGLVNKGATSFHASEEHWNDVLQINSDMGQDELNENRKSWDLLIDIDSPFLDCSKIAAKLILSALEHFGISNYGLKFSGKKGFHIILGGSAFPKEYKGMRMREMFPEWPRAITEYLMEFIKKDYYKEAGKILSESEIEKRSGLKKEDMKTVHCKQCTRTAKKGMAVLFKCPVCGLEANRRDFKLTKRRLRCLNNGCAGVLEILEHKDYFYCEYCKDQDNDKIQINSERHPENFEEYRGVNIEKIAKLDLVLVAPRHLFRMPYSLHDMTSLASVVLSKDEIENFNPRGADPMRVKIRKYYPENKEDEAKKLLISALEWKNSRKKEEEVIEKKRYESYEKIDLGNVTEEMFPKPIKKLLKGGLKDGKKRGLFILITFFKSCGFPGDYINSRVREWNKLNDPSLKEGYIKGQVDWHLRQRKKILPPNYDNESFYKDMGLIEDTPRAKNPIVEVLRLVRRKQS